MLRHYATYGSAAMVVMCLLVGHPVQAQTATPDACATDGAARWATVLAYESPTPTATATATRVVDWLCTFGDVIDFDGATVATTVTVLCNWDEYEANVQMFLDGEFIGAENVVDAVTTFVDFVADVKNASGRHELHAHVHPVTYSESEGNWLNNDCYATVGAVSTPTPTPTVAPYLACHVAASANYSTTQLTVSYENFYTTTLGTHHVDAYVYIDDVLAHDAMFSLIGGASAGDFTISLQPRHLTGLHEVHYVLESQEHAPVNAECFAHFGAPLADVEVYRDSADRVHVKRYEETTGDIMLATALIVPAVVFLIIGILFGGYQFVKPNADHK